MTRVEADEVVEVRGDRGCWGVPVRVADEVGHHIVQTVVRRDLHHVGQDTGRWERAEIEGARLRCRPPSGPRRAVLPRTTRSRAM
ncbi:hypothetical protein ACFC34_26330 [Streptomyces sp. NPDC056053]|uniref:hypothetical protein n=1 Tax=Streptomyces sp. NPDC056053 TaxID=3345696 RepID=UPI0011E8007C